VGSGAAGGAGGFGGGSGGFAGGASGGAGGVGGAVGQAGKAAVAAAAGAGSKPKPETLKYKAYEWKLPATVKDKDGNVIKTNSKELFSKKFGDEFTKNPSKFSGGIKFAGDDLGKVGGGLVHNKEIAPGVKASVLSAEASAKWGIEQNGAGVKAGISGEAGAYLGKVSYTGKLAGADVAASAYVGANVKGEVGAVFNANQAYVQAGGSAFIGGKAEGSVKYGTDIGGVPVGAALGGDVRYGLSAEADVKAGYDNGKLKFGGKIGASLGVGAGVNFNVEIDARKAVNEVIGVGKSAASTIKGWWDAL
ncbi:MAG TPA: hypothetical protein PLD47_15065, partial [Aggregatilineales bacterium]|nr:hypothetical protein [Aggregatilineales bacterium]